MQEGTTLMYVYYEMFIFFLYYYYSFFLTFANANPYKINMVETKSRVWHRKSNW